MCRFAVMVELYAVSVGTAGVPTEEREKRKNKMKNMW